jgi:hypothetical protein
MGDLYIARSPFMRLSLLAVCLLLVSTQLSFAAQSAGARWEQALLTAKRHGTLAGPRPGQKCLWSQPLGACLWYTPAKWDPWLR